MDKEILFLTEGGKNIGFEHLRRCPALVQGIEEYMSKWINKNME